MPTIGILGSLKFRAWTASARPDAASNISEEWNAPLTGRGIVFLAPRAEARSMARATAILSPLITIWSSVFMFASSTPVSSQIWAKASSFSPRMAAIAPGRLTAAWFISSPRLRTSLTASEKSMTSAATREVYSPKLWPATALAFIASGPCISCQVRQAATLIVIIAGWEFAVF